MLETYLDHSPRIAPGAFVHDRAVLIGRVELAVGASVWPNATLRGDDGPIIIGEASSIQDGSAIHSTTGLSSTKVGNRVTVGHGAILHGCIIEDECIIGMGAIVQDNAVIQRGAIVGAGALVPPGTVIPAGTVVVGQPARHLRDCHDGDRGMIEFSWREYAERTREYLAAQRA